MKISQEAHLGSFTCKMRTALKTAAFLAGFVAIYVWLLMFPSDQSFWASMFTESPFRLYVVGFALDSLCLLLLFLGFFMRRRLNAVCVIGLSFSGLSFILRLLDHSNPSSDIFWFEPYLRSGVYAASFGLALAAHRFSRSDESPNNLPKS